MSVSTGVEFTSPPKTTPGSTPFRRRSFTFLPRMVRGRTASFWASATTKCSLISSLRRPNYGGLGRRREIDDHAKRRRERQYGRAHEMVEPGPPDHDALE